MNSTDRCLVCGPQIARLTIQQQRTSQLGACPPLDCGHKRILSTPETFLTCCQEVETEPNNTKNVGKNISEGRNGVRELVVEGWSWQRNPRDSDAGRRGSRELQACCKHISTLILRFHTCCWDPSQANAFYHWSPVFLFFSSILSCSLLKGIHMHLLDDKASGLYLHFSTSFLGVP